MEIQVPAPASMKDAKFSILIPTWNNLSYLKLCVRSIQQNSAFAHQLIVHVNDGSDGTLDWVRAEGVEHSWSQSNVGVCNALNAAAQLAKTSFICFFNDDMYALPGWDDALWTEIQTIDHDKWFISSTMIEPTDTGNPCVLAPYDFGRNTESFDESALLRSFAHYQMQDWRGGTWPPNVLPKKLWDLVGGYSEEFSPGMSSDPDFSMKLWQVGVRYFKGLAQSRVYHFQTKSTGKVIKNNGPLQFLRKWGITQGTFGKYYLRRGTIWRGPQAESGPFLALTLAKIKSLFKRTFSTK